MHLTHRHISEMEVLPVASAMTVGKVNYMLHDAESVFEF